MKTIARIRSVFPSKFGIPHQSGCIESLESRIVFEPEYRNADAIRGIEEFDYIWLIWEFSECVRSTWSPTVRPPRLGGNERIGVFATRSPYRPNPLGLSSVRLLRVEITAKEGPTLIIAGADLMDGTPIYDIKPYIRTDIHENIRAGFTDNKEMPKLDVEFPENLLKKIPEQYKRALIEVLERDPRPRYQKDPERIYGMPFDHFDVRFRVSGNTLTVTDVVNVEEK
ncbi:MAG: tRNA (N6-threonylcarbamoyladenosine(37)-N6)-methyltransferase TrmO [Blautia sp.]|nr:tRNA (N6-threonylcarbamoyladenosine(37)-N6)-methyltransferase TrmO [Blautia sp.]